MVAKTKEQKEEYCKATFKHIKLLFERGEIGKVKENSALSYLFLKDLEARINSHQRMLRVAYSLRKICCLLDKNIKDYKPEEIRVLIDDLRTGKIKKIDGRKFNLVQIHRTLSLFWSWLYSTQQVYLPLQRDTFAFDTAGRRDINNSAGMWTNWKQRAKAGLFPTNKNNIALILEMLNDFELGINLSKFAKNKGRRSPARLFELGVSAVNFSRIIEERDFTSLNKYDLSQVFKDMQEGKILTKMNRRYNHLDNYVKNCKGLYGWLCRTGKMPEDISLDLVQPRTKGKWCYLTEQQLGILLDNCEEKYKAVVALFIDTGARVNELYNVRVCDFEKDFSQLHIRPETSKNRYERTINLNFSGQLIKDFVEKQGLKNEDYIIRMKPDKIRDYLKVLCGSLFGCIMSNAKAGLRYDEIDLYSFRHSVSCLYLNKYQSPLKLMYRFGWKNPKWIEYYSEFLGMRDEVLKKNPTDVLQKLGNLEEENKKLKEMLMQQLLKKQQ